MVLVSKYSHPDPKEVASKNELINLVKSRYYY